MTTMTSLLRKGDSIRSQIRSANNAGNTARNSEKLSKVIRILNDVCEDPTRYCRIVRSQIGACEHTLFTYNQINRRAVEGSLAAVDVIQEYISQERADGVPDSVTDEQITSLWGENISLGRIISANPHKLSNHYQGRGKEGAKPYSSLIHWARAMTEVAEGGVAEGGEIEELLYDMMQAFHSNFWVDSANCMEDDFENACPGFQNAFETATEEPSW